MITAKQAYIETVAYKTDMFRLQLNQVENKINNSCKKGEFECVIGNELFPKVKEELQNIGFKVNTEYFRNECNTTISWSK